MKRYFLIAITLAALCFSRTASAAEDPRAYARRQQAAEQQQSFNARLTALEEALQAYQNEVTALRAEIRSLRQQLAQASGSSADVASLAEKIREVDQKRQADNQKVIDALKQLQKSSAAAAAAASRAPARTTTDDYEYEIRPGDTLYEIVTGLSAEGFNITVDQVKKANPTVKWNKLQIGQKIVIPAPKR